MVASTVPVKPGAPNPASVMVRSVIDRQSEFAAIAKKIIAEARMTYGTTNLTPFQRAEFKQLVAHKLAAEKRRWCGMIIEASQEPVAPAVMPPPPPSKSLYGLIADGSEIVDVGSGNCLRLSADSGRLKIVAVDPEVQENQVAVKKLEREVAPKDVEGKLVTSYNALCQIPPGEVKTAIVSQDGLHVLPDHNVLIEMGCAKRDGDKVVALAPDKVYEDYSDDLKGYPVAQGYKLCPTYKRRSISFKASTDYLTWQRDSYRPKIDCSPCGPADMDWNDLGWKWDGVPLEFEIQQGLATITRRDGSFVQSEVTGDLVDMSLHAEKVGDYLILLRVECYRGIVPPHSGELLRYFCERVSVDWNGMRMVGPPPLDPLLGPVINGVTLPVDGVITRVLQRDYYVKSVWTLDLYASDVANVVQRMREQGKTVRVDTKEGLWEYEVHKKEENFDLIPVKKRTDKTLATTMATVDYLMGLPTLNELAAVTGVTPEMSRLAAHFVDV